jgi:predicted flap endonuclease-1-like 5' DNA nuclease
MEWWIWLLLIVVLLSLIVLIVLLILWSRRGKEEESATAQERGLAPQAAGRAAEETAQESMAEDQQAPAESAPDSAVQPLSKGTEATSKRAPSDDLKIIEGIGTRIASVFQAAGITTFDQLAAAEVDELRRILVEADIRLGDPTTWPEQARLAAKEQWQELASFQDSLKGGRRI